MKIERTTKIILETEDKYAVSTVLDIVSEIYNKMNDESVFVVNGVKYTRDYVGRVQGFLFNFYRNDDCSYEINEG